MECLALTVEEVMHIRQVLVKAELEKYQQYKDVYTALKKGKVEPLTVDGSAGLEDRSVTGMSPEDTVCWPDGIGLWGDSRR